jgi:hypothetical protein
VNGSVSLGISFLSEWFSYDDQCCSHNFELMIAWYVQQFKLDDWVLSGRVLCATVDWYTMFDGLVNNSWHTMFCMMARCHIPTFRNLQSRVGEAFQLART